MQTADTNARNRGWKRAKWWIAGLIIFILAAGVLALRIPAALRANQALEAIRRAGLPTSPEELERWHASVPPSKNAALVVLDAAALVVQPPPGVEPYEDEFGAEPGVPFSPEYRRILAGHVERNRAAIAKLHEAARLQRTRYPINLAQGFVIMVPHLARIKNCAQLLKAEALDTAAEGGSERALRAIHTSFSIAEGIRREPLLISELVGIACVAINLGALEYIVSAVPLSEDQLASLSQRLWQIEQGCLPAARRALVGERAFALGGFSMTPAELDALSAGGGGFLRRPAYFAWKVSGLRERDKRLYLEVMQGYISAATNTFPQAVLAADQAQKRMDQRLNSGLGKFAILTRMVLASGASAIRKEAALAASLRCARTALAIERWRLEHGGGLPSDLAALSPRYLREIPADPFNGEPLEYRVEDGGAYRIISRGASANRKKPDSVSFAVAASAAERHSTPGKPEL